MTCVREKENSHNNYVVTVMKNGVIFVNLPVASFHCSSKCFTYLRIDMCSVKLHMFRLFNHHNFSSYNFSPWLSESQISESLLTKVGNFHEFYYNLQDGGHLVM